jgi:hypothetical protein
MSAGVVTVSENLRPEHAIKVRIAARGGADSGGVF